MAGGVGTEGQGWDGGTPVDETVRNGGGGGGSAVTAAEGRGKADGTPGAGRPSDITGVEVVYAGGGRGGNPQDDSYAPADAAGYGFGGDGAVSGFGGSGSDGVVIVRIVKVFDYKYVDLPDYLTGIIWTNNTTATSFDYNAQPASWKEGVEFSGTNSVYCYFSNGETVTNGLGRHSFTLTLKDEYLWNLGPNGSDAPFTAYWRVLEPGTIGQADVKIAKNVEWAEGGNAKISIDVDLIPEIKEVQMNVLFLSGLCSAHGYSANVAKAAIDAATEVANVDYYFFDNVKTTSSAAPKYSGHLDKGQKFNANTLSLTTNNHGPLYGFYETLWSQVVNNPDAVKYDYIVFSFDRTKAATTYAGKHAHEAEVAAFLKPYYEKNAVIWLVDDDPENCVNNGQVFIQQTPWFPSQLVYIYYASGSSSGWTTLAGYISEYNTGAGSSDARVSLNALIGLFTPSKYPVANYTAPTLNNSKRIQYNTTTYNAIMQSAGDAIANQCVYNDASRVRDLIKEIVVAKSFTGVINDNVCVDMGLQVNGASAIWTTNETIMGWVPTRVPEELRITDEGVIISISNLFCETKVKLYIDVEDTGSFLNSEEGAKYNERTGKWEKDPNNGPVVVRLRPDGADEILAQAEASTSIPWAYTAHKVTAELVHGQGTWSINGFVEKDSVSVGAGYSPEVVFRGDTGWVLDYLEIDGKVIEDFDPSTIHWVFQNISADHVIRFGFEKANFKLLRAVQRYPWNNLVDIDYYINAEGQVDSCMIGRLVFFVEYEAENGGTVRKQLKTFRDNDIMFHNWYSADPSKHWDPYWTSLKDGAHWPFAKDETIKLGGVNQPRFNRTGYHRITWDSNADGVSIFQKKKVRYYMYVCEGEEK